MNRIKIITLWVTFFCSFPLWALNEKDNAAFDSLGGNGVLLEKAKALNPEIATSVVQNRLVQRDKRWEFSGELGGSFGGDTYTRSTLLGLQTHYHFTPRWSVGAKFQYALNRLTPEGEALVSKATQDHLENPQSSQAPIPAVDFPLNEMSAFLEFYPIYGKLAWMDSKVIHFDVYAQMGAGQVTLKSGAVPTYFGGLGVGLWPTPKFSTRLEVRYQNYEATYFTGKKSLDMAILSAQVGWLL